MTAALNLFYPWALPHISGVPDPYLDQCIRDACIDFCVMSDAVQRVLTPINVVALTQDYAVTPPSDMLLVRVKFVGMEGVELGPVPTDQVDSATALSGGTVGSDTIDTGTPKWFFQKTPGSTSISLHPVPDVASTAGLVIKASFKPTLTALVVDDLLYNEYAEAIAMGAVARVKATPHQPFTGDPRMYALRFASAAKMARDRASFGQIAGAGRIAARKFV